MALLLLLFLIGLNLTIYYRQRLNQNVILLKNNPFCQGSARFKPDLIPLERKFIVLSFRNSISNSFNLNFLKGLTFQFKFKTYHMLLNRCVYDIFTIIFKLLNKMNGFKVLSAIKDKNNFHSILSWTRTNLKSLQNIGGILPFQNKMFERMTNFVHLDLLFIQNTFFPLVHNITLYSFLIQFIILIGEKFIK